MPPPNIIGNITGGQLVLLGGGFIAGTILLTYYLCAWAGDFVPYPEHCPKFLPTISNTWEMPPGSYISRWVVGVGCDMMAVCQLIIYWINESAASKTGVRSRPWLSHKFLLAQSVFAIFCLSWVGAICDSTVDTCRGNNSLHTTFAVTFFVLYDLYMLILHIQNSAGGHPLIRTMLLVATLVSKLRWIPAVSLAVGDNALAIVEWTDVSIILLWTVHYILASPLGTVLNYGEAWETDESSLGTDLGVLSYVNARVLANITAVIMVGTLVTTLIAGIHNGVVTKDRVPWISDLWVYPPGNWISRWAVVQGCHAAVWVHVAAWQAGWWNSSGFKKPAPLILPLIAILGLSIVGCVNEDEDHTIHVAAAGTFFVCYDLFMVYELLVQITGPSLKSGFVFKLAAATVALASQLGRFVILPTLFSEASQGGILANLPQILEWTNAFAILAFMTKHIYSEEYSKYFWMVVYSKDQSLTAPDTKPEPSIELETKLLTGEV